MKTSIWSITFILGLAAVYFPRILLYKHEQIHGRMLINNPKYHNNIKNHLWLISVWLVVFGVLYYVLGRALHVNYGDKVFYLFNAWISTSSIFDGVFAYRTKIYPISYRSATYYIIDSSEILRKIGFYQIICGLLLSIANIALVFIRL
jgi:hypothetical protein